MKTCNKCHTAKPVTEFYKKSTAKDGLFWWCRDCHKTYVKAKYAAAYSDPNFAAQERKRLADYLKKHPEKRTTTWPTGAKAIANVMRYRNGKAKRTPNWLTPDDFWMMEQAYELARLRTDMLGFQWEVDHEIPLRGKLVSGLHVPDNLRVVPKLVNRDKSNRFVVS
jgi:hypothetical protein